MAGYRLAACAKVGKTVFIGTNSAKPHAKFGWLHAETAVLLAAKASNVPPAIYVTRVDAKGRNTMAKPCLRCQSFLKEAKVKVVYYTDWSGEWKALKL